jgi:hypothetical protein
VTVVPGFAASNCAPSVVNVPVSDDAASTVIAPASGAALPPLEVLEGAGADVHPPTSSPAAIRARAARAVRGRGVTRATIRRYGRNATVVAHLRVMEPDPAWSAAGGS